MVGAEQPVHLRFLVMLDAADAGERFAQGRAHPRRQVLEANGLALDAIHQDDAHARECVIVELADLLLDELTPGEALALERGAFAIEKLQSHERLLVRVGCLKAADRAMRMPMLDPRPLRRVEQYGSSASAREAWRGPGESPKAPLLRQCVRAPNTVRQPRGQEVPTPAAIGTNTLPLAASAATE